jgi:hypothetical protein
VREQCWINLHDMLVPLADGGFLWASERSGYMHLYRYDAAVPAALQAVLTAGEWVVEVRIAKAIIQKRRGISASPHRDQPHDLPVQQDGP